VTPSNDGAVVHPKLLSTARPVNTGAGLGQDIRPTAETRPGCGA